MKQSTPTVEEVLAKAMVTSRHEEWNDQDTLSEAKAQLDKIYAQKLLEMIGEDEPSHFSSLPLAEKAKRMWQNHYRAELREAIKRELL